MSNRSFYVVAVSFFVGVAVRSFCDISMVVLIAGALSLIAATYFSRKNQIAVLIVGAGLAMVLGALRTGYELRGPHSLDAEINKNVTLTGVVCAEPATKELTEQVCFAPRGSRDRIVITAPRYPGYAYGDILTVAGKFTLPKNFSTGDDGLIFDYISYLAKDHIRYVMFRPKMIKTGSGGNIIVVTLLGVKDAVVEKIKKLLPEPHAALLSGILLGERRSIPPEIVDDFKKSGLIHVVILSGYSITLVATSILRTLSFLPKVAANSLGALAIIAFAIMTGASAMTVRASLMALIALGARSFGRRYDAMRGLCVAAFLMVMQNPLILAFDTAFQISLMSVMGLIYVSPLLLDHMEFVTERWGMREIVAATASTQIFVMPLILYYMGQISVISIVPNIILLPILPWTMLISFLMIVVGFVYLPIAIPFAWVAHEALSYMLWIVTTFGGLPFAAIQITISVRTLMVIYSVYVVILIFLWRRRNSLQRSASSD